jgi:RHS repeat-associated protein
MSLVTDGAGAVLSRQAYTPWGDRRGAGNLTQTTLDYTGQKRDDTGLLYYNARYYDPTLGRFISPDTIAPDRGDPQTRNRYSYVLNNPLKFTDPTGHCAQDGSDGDNLDDCRNAEAELGTYGLKLEDLYTWKLAELNMLRDAIARMMAKAGWTTVAEFRQAILPVGYDVYIRRNHSRSSDAGYTERNRFTQTITITLYENTFYDYDGSLKDIAAKATFVHELAHVWDMGKKGAPSRGMMNATGSTYDCYLGFLFCSWNSNGTTASWYASRSDHTEDWAEAVAASVYPEHEDYQYPDGSQRMDEARKRYVQEQFARYRRPNGR